jgi:hypothetical protein
MPSTGTPPPGVPGARKKNRGTGKSGGTGRVRSSWDAAKRLLGYGLDSSRNQARGTSPGPAMVSHGLWSRRCATPGFAPEKASSGWPYIDSRSGSVVRAERCGPMTAGWREWNTAM